MNSSDATVARPGRPAERQNLIVQELREQIVGGKLSPGSRLPTRDEIGQKYGASANTVQRALDRLRQDGFVHASGRNGTHVSTEPPHLTRYAVVFPAMPTDSAMWVRFWTALSNEAVHIQHEQGRTLPLYYGVDGDAGKRDYQALQSDVLAHRVAGIIFASMPHLLVGRPIVDEPGIPRLGIMAPSDQFKMPAIHTSMHSFYEKALGYLRERGCRRIGLINPPCYQMDYEQLQQKICSLGMDSEPYWNHVVHLGVPQSARNIAHLMMSLPKRERPDGLVVSDDNLVEYATSGLVAAGVRVPDDVEVVAHCNFPWPAPSAVPVQRLGFDAREVLQTAIQQIDAMRRGKAVPPVTSILARFESEVLA